MPIKRRLRAAVSASSRVQKSAIVKAAPKPKESKKEKEKDCSICMEDLSQQRQTKIACGHQFHRTCILSWLEKQLKSSDQTCPNCRAPYGFIMNGRKKEKSIGAYGDSQQPSLWYIHRLAKERQEKEPRSPYKTCLELTQQRQLAKTMQALKELQTQRSQFFVDGTVPREYIYDVDNEISKLSIRKKIYKEVEILAGAIGAGLLPERSQDVAWNLEAELREVRSRENVRGSTPINSSEDEIIEEESDSDTDRPRGGTMRIHAMSSRRIYIIISDSDDEDDQGVTSV